MSNKKEAKKQSELDLQDFTDDNKTIDNITDVSKLGSTAKNNGDPTTTKSSNSNGSTVFKNTNGNTAKKVKK